MSLTNAAKHRMLNHLAGRLETDGPITTMTLHNASPPTLANELSGGEYAPQPVVFTNAGVESAGQIDFESIVFEVPAGETVRAVVMKDAAGVFMVEKAVPEESFNQAGQYRVTSDSFLKLN